MHSKTPIVLLEYKMHSKTSIVLQEIKNAFKDTCCFIRI